jgi:hypothetical protein
MNKSSMGARNLREEIHRLNGEIETLETTVKRLEKYKEYDQSSEELKAVMDSYIRVGFSEDQAFTLLQMVVAHALQKPGDVVNFNAKGE